MLPLYTQAPAPPPPPILLLGRLQNPVCHAVLPASVPGAPGHLAVHVRNLGSFPNSFLFLIIFHSLFLSPPMSSHSGNSVNSLSDKTLTFIHFSVPCLGPCSVTLMACSRYSNYAGLLASCHPSLCLLLHLTARPSSLTCKLDHRVLVLKTSSAPQGHRGTFKFLSVVGLTQNVVYRGCMSSWHIGYNCLP